MKYSLGAHRIHSLALFGSLIACGSSEGLEPQSDTDEDAAASTGSAGPTTDGSGSSDTGSDTADDDDGSSGTGTDEPAFQPGTAVEIDSGWIQGVQDGDLRLFRGVPFAAPPVDALRFTAPAPVQPWEGVFDATHYGASCPQPEIPLFNEPAYGPGPLSEDCLNLNVWAYDDPTPRPVMVFIHGGAFVTGSGSASLYESSDLSRRGDVVVVTINYRLGALGFLATEALAEESGEDSAGNYGLKDQVAALQWVRRNIAVFGGDPDNVTIFGESAGGISVCGLLAAPAADGLYHRALIESGIGCADLARERDATILGQPAAIDDGERIAADLGCEASTDQLSCLRSLDVDAMVDASSLTSLLLGDTNSKTLPVSPHVDGVFIPEQPLERLADGEADVPLITGTNADEAALFFAATPVLSRLDLRREVAAFIGDETLADQVLEIYPWEDYPIAKDAFLTMVTDFGFACPNLAVAAAAREGVPSYLYEFQRVYPGLGVMGSFHALELAYVFGNFEAIGIIPGPEDYAVREELQRAWTSFARTGQPAMSAGWEPYADAGETIAVLDADPRLQTEADFRGGRCEALRQLGLVP